MQAMLIGVAGFSAVLGLLLLRVPVAVALGVAGLAGVVWQQGWGHVLLLQTGLDVAVIDGLAVVPLLAMMSTIASHAGLSRQIYDAALALLGHWRGGLAMASLLAAAAFAAVCGSAVAAAATICRVTLPDMRRRGYADGLSAASIAAGSTLGLLLPPSILLMLYALLTGQSLGKLYVAALLPSLLGLLLYMAATRIGLRGGAKAAATKLPAQSWAMRGRQLAAIWPLLVLFVVVMGGLFIGLLPSQAAALGLVAALGFALAAGTLTGPRFKTALLEAAQITGMVMLVLLGALFFTMFLSAAQVPQVLAGELAASGINPVLFLLLLALGYWLLGSMIDDLAVIVLTLPFVFPMAQALAIDPIWFGIYLVTIVEIGLILPPWGMLLFVIQGSSGVKATAIMRGMLPFMAANLLRVALLIAFPALALALPGLMH